MKVEIYTQIDFHARPPTRAKCVWKGELPLIPREGDYISVHKDFASTRVEQVHWDVRTQIVEIVLFTTDAANEYPAVDPFPDEQ